MPNLTKSHSQRWRSSNQQLILSWMKLGGPLEEVYCQHYKPRSHGHFLPFWWKLFLIINWSSLTCAKWWINHVLKQQDGDISSFLRLIATYTWEKASTRAQLQCYFALLNPNAPASVLEQKALGEDSQRRLVRENDASRFFWPRMEIKNFCMTRESCMRLCGLVEGFMAPDEDLPLSVLCVFTDLVAVQNMALSPIKAAFTKAS